jgi:uncharacterized protein (TIGR03435 family)
MNAAIILALLFAGTAAFDIATVKECVQAVGPDGGNRFTFTPTGFSARNATLHRLTAEAYHLQAFQVQGGPKWIHAAEYDVEARSALRGSPSQLREKLQALLEERFHLVFRRELKETRIYRLSIDKDGPKLIKSGKGRFHGDLRQFADFLAIQLSISEVEDPTKPATATATPIPVVDKTGLAGEFDIDITIQPEPNTPMFTLWHRVLRERLGLQLEAVKVPVEIVVVESANRKPTAN